ncbi:MAG: hypothetical protein GF372_00390 [Candidatus Marinimicrobia bacterium]|nr:hypothetical protein [Candidatus Neomarinimicrobiota bacterium]
MKKTGLLGIFLFSMLIPVFVAAQSGFSGAYIGRFTTQERMSEAGDAEQHMRLYNRLMLRYEPSEKLAVRTALRRADFFQEEVGSTDIYYGYVYYEPLDWANITVGRQYPYSKMIRRAVDGGSAEITLKPGLTLEGLVGVFAPYDRDGFTETPEDERGSYVGLQYKAPNMASIRGSFYQQVSNGRILNFAGLDGRYVDLYGFNLYGFFKYNFSESLVQEAEGQLSRGIGENLNATVAFKYRDPNFDIPVWYWQFNVDPYSTLRASLDFFATANGSITAEYFSRIMNDVTINRYKLGWQALNWSLGAVYAVEDEKVNEEWNFYGSVQHHFFNRTLLVGAGANYFDYIFTDVYEDPLNAFGVQLFAKYRVWSTLTIGARGYYIENARYDEDIRAVGELSYQF